ncbi:MAG: urease accessory protein UreG [Gammaproteobacteria bacterium]|nr:urease accessory protein UreG [Gammaproteobacteria bacterium]
MNTPAQKLGAARVGIGGPVGSGKTALIETLIPRLKQRGCEAAIVTNDLVTREDAERLKHSGIIDPDRVVGVETGACPHTAIREDPTLNIEAANLLEQNFAELDMILIESGGDNLASTFSLDLVDYWMFVIDVAAGDDIPRKRGPGVMQCDLLIINKVDLAPYVQVDLDVIKRDIAAVRGERPVIFTNCLSGEGIDQVVDHLAHQVLLEA